MHPLHTPAPSKTVAALAPAPAPAPSPTKMAAAAATTTVATLAFFCLCLNVGLCRTIAPAVAPAATNSSSSGSKVLRLELIPRDSPLTATSNRSASFLRSLTESDRIGRAIQRSHGRLAEIEGSLRTARSGKLGQNKLILDGYQAPVTGTSGAYVVELTIGIPTLRYQAILDTGSSLIWTQCKPCINCYPQPTPIFDPAEDSFTYETAAYDSRECRWLPEGHFWRDRNNDCGFQINFEDGSKTEGVLASEVFTFSGVAFRNVFFGCGHDNVAVHNFAGGVGLGGGQLSLPAQFARAVGSDGTYFAYCLSSPTGGTSPMWVGPNAIDNFPSGATLSFTPLISSPYMGTLYHYVDVVGIYVGGTAVNIPRGAFDFQSNGDGGVIMDSGTTLTYLETRTYNNLLDAIRANVQLSPVDGSSVGMGLCYDALDVASEDILFPEVRVEFQGTSANLRWNRRNYMVEMNNMLCAALAPTDHVSVIGNLAQINHFMLFDTSLHSLTFAPTDCDYL